MCDMKGNLSLKVVSSEDVTNLGATYDATLLEPENECLLGPCIFEIIHTKIDACNLGYVKGSLSNDKTR